jgi:1,4-alpha-glucan branching enzyme
MHDTLRYFARDPFFRKYHQSELTFRQVYAFQENYVLPLSHDEVVYGKGSLLGKMPGDQWRRLANLRLLLAYMYAQPGKKLLFMGGEFGAWLEWNHQEALDWRLAELPGHLGVQELVRRLNDVYRAEPALHRLDADARGFEWIDANDTEHSVLSFLRHAPDREESIAVVLNFTPVPQYGYRVGVDVVGTWHELVNTDASEYGGSGHGNFGQVEAVPTPRHGRGMSLSLTLPPLGALFLKAPGRQ